MTEVTTPASDGPRELASPKISFEFFPPKTEEMERSLWETINRLAPLAPKFVSVTYGAGGSTRSKTLDVVEGVHRKFGCPVASHLTCVGSTIDELRAYLREAADRGVQNIVALRGDPPKGVTAFTPVAGGLRYANELVQLIRAEFPSFGIAVAGYPEKHQEAVSLAADLTNLKRKVDAGADAVVTQLFYDNRDFVEFRERCEQLGVSGPIIPGILPGTNPTQIQRITSHLSLIHISRCRPSTLCRSRWAPEHYKKKKKKKHNE